MHHYLGTPLWGLDIWSNGDVQLSLTLLWVILAFILMTFSSRRHIHQIWFVGAALLGIVVAKLLLLDLSQKRYIDTRDLIYWFGCGHAGDCLSCTAATCALRKIRRGLINSFCSFKFFLMGILIDLIIINGKGRSIKCIFGTGISI